MTEDLSKEAPHFHVAIFGSARIKEGDPVYKEIYELASEIAKEGMDVVTGGGPGLMEAASSGHHDSDPRPENVHSVGLNIKLPHEQHFNPHLDIHKEFDHFSQRLDTFMNLSDVVVVAPGGIGTLLELFYTWQLVQVKHICNTPIILMGEAYEGLIGWVEEYLLGSGYISEDDLNTIFLARNNKEAMKVIKVAHEAFKQGGEDFCLNYKKYRID